MPCTDLKLKLANSTESELKTLQSSLRSAVDDTSAELQRSVFKKYAIFSFHEAYSSNNINMSVMLSLYLFRKKYLFLKMKC